MIKTNDWYIFECIDNTDSEIANTKHNQRLAVWWEGWSKTPILSYVDVKIMLSSKDFSRIMNPADLITLAPAYDCMRIWIKHMEEKYE